jgi:NTP pyrophosphatase (non-canonical NTP hydrolase)
LSSAICPLGEGESVMFPNEMQTIEDFQEFHRWLDEQKGFSGDIYLNMVLLSGEVGEVAQVLKRVHHMQDPQLNDGETKTLEEALDTHREDIGQELADCLAYIFKLANYTGVDLQQAYLAKMEKNLERTWKYKRAEEENSRSA